MNNQYPNQYPKKDYVSIIITQDNIAYFNAIQKQQRDIVALQKKLLEQKKTQELEDKAILDFASIESSRTKSPLAWLRSWYSQPNANSSEIELLQIV